MESMKRSTTCGALRAGDAGTKVVLDLRSQYGQPQKQLTDVSKYVDTKYLEAALKGRM